MDLEGRVALVSGASRGIGRAAAIALAKAGADVVVNYYAHADEAEAVASAVEGEGRRSLCVQADVADLDAVEGMVEKAVDAFGRLDMAVSNSAFSQREPFYEADVEAFRRTVDVTMWGAFHVVRSAARQMITQGGGGSIVVVSSPHAFLAVPRSMAYNMSKAAIDHMARTAAIELAEQRIRVNVVHPGWTDTPGERKFATEEEIRRGGEQLPWGRLATAEEIARGVVFLCDPASDYMTGGSMLIDGGISLPWWANRGSAVPD